MSVYVTSTLLFIALVILSSCGGNQGNFDRHGKLTPSKADLKQKQQDTQTDIRAGGEPGTITLSGVLVKADESLDSRITVQQRKGSSQGSSNLVATQNLVSIPDLKRAESYQQLKTNSYINLGCNLKNDSRIEGLKEAVSEVSEAGKVKVALLTADKIFVCGELNIAEDYVTLKANEINLQTAKMIKKGNVADIQLITDVLNVEGENVLLSLGKDSDLPSLLAAPTIKLEVYEKVQGTGSLAIKAIGSSYKAAVSGQTSK